MEIYQNETLKSKALKLLKFIDNYYYVILAIILFVCVIPLYFSSASINTKILSSLYWFIAITAGPDIRKDVKWLPFIILCIPFIAFLGVISSNGYAFWGKILSWQVTRKIVVDLNPIFRNIPFNDAAFARIYKNETLTWFMRLVYNNGFVTSALIPIYRAILLKDFKKMCKYLCSAHVFQIFLISPFYMIFHLQEVWYVLGDPDGLARNFTPLQAKGWTLNCFPSMHTSICFAMFLLVIREKDTFFKWIWGFLCLSVIYSTMYLEVHWVIDVLAGLLLAYVTVKLVDFIFDKLTLLIPSRIKKLFFRKNEAEVFETETPLTAAE